MNWAESLRLILIESIVCRDFQLRVGRLVVADGIWRLLFRDEKWPFPTFMVLWLDRTSCPALGCQTGNATGFYTQTFHRNCFAVFSLIKRVSFKLLPRTIKTQIRIPNLGSSTEASHHNLIRDSEFEGPKFEDPKFECRNIKLSHSAWLIICSLVIGPSCHSSLNSNTEGHIICWRLQLGATKFGCQTAAREFWRQSELQSLSFRVWRHRTVLDSFGGFGFRRSSDSFQQKSSSFRENNALPEETSEDSDISNSIFLLWESKNFAEESPVKIVLGHQMKNSLSEDLWQISEWWPLCECVRSRMAADLFGYHGVDWSWMMGVPDMKCIHWDPKFRLLLYKRQWVAVCKLKGIQLHRVIRWSSGYQSRIADPFSNTPYML